MCKTILFLGAFVLSLSSFFLSTAHAVPSGLPPGDRNYSDAATAISPNLQLITNPVLPTIPITVDRPSFIIPGIPVPPGQQIWQYQPVVSPVTNANPSETMPVALGDVAGGGNSMSITAGLSRFTGPVDIYFAIFAPALDPDNVYLLRSDNTIRRASEGIGPWKSGVTSGIDQLIAGNIPIAGLPAGTYEFYLAATPAGSAERYYVWKTAISISRTRLPGGTVVVEPDMRFGLTPPGLEPSDPAPPDFMLDGDLDIVWARPVQVLDFAPLVAGKATAFRVKVRSTFIIPVDVRFRLTLPSEHWRFVTGSKVNLLGLPPGWAWPDTWGPIRINPGDNEVMLPHVASGDAAVSVPNPAGIVRGTCTAQGLCGPDVRVLPVPRETNASGIVNFRIDIDPDNAVEETNETNNAFQGSVGPIVPARGWHFLFVPTIVLYFAPPDDAPPRLQIMNDLAKLNTEYVLGLFPIPDQSLTYQMVAPTATMPCPDDGTQQCGYALVWNPGESRDQIFAKAKDLANSQGHSYDFIVVYTRGSGGGAQNHNDAVGIGDSAGTGILAHEFNHAVTGMGDVYVLDCLARTGEAYCEHPNGVREYCCNPSEYGLPEIGPYCTQDANNNISCDYGQFTENCVRQCTDAATCANECNNICSGGAVFGSPDCRNRHPSSKGLWANKWYQIDDRMNYIMDCNWQNSIPFPVYWMVLGSTRAHCSQTPFQDGYYNLLKNSRFRIEPLGVSP